MKVTVLYTTDQGTHSSRQFKPVSGLRSGFEGSEKIKATYVNPNGVIIGDKHHLPDNGPYSLTFNTVEATAIALRVERHLPNDRPFVHYRLNEVELSN